MTYDNWKLAEPQERREYEQSALEADYGLYSRTYYEPYLIDEEFSGWVLYDENDREAERPLRSFSSLREAKDWIDLENEGPQ